MEMEFPVPGVLASIIQETTAFRWLPVCRPCRVVGRGMSSSSMCTLGPPLPFILITPFWCMSLSLAVAGRPRPFSPVTLAALAEAVVSALQRSSPVSTFRRYCQQLPTRFGCHVAPIPPPHRPRPPEVISWQIDVIQPFLSEELSLTSARAREMRHPDQVSSPHSSHPSSR